MNFDHSVLYFFNQALAGPVLDVVMWFLTVWGLWIPPLIGITYFLSGQRRVGSSLLMTIGASFVLTLTFYYLAMRPRPEDVRLILPTPGFPSFPSGHATMAFGFATAWVLTARQGTYLSQMANAQPNGQSRYSLAYATIINPILLYPIVYLGAALIAVSRLYLGHHYPSDVMAGTVLGCAVGAAVYGLSRVDRSLAQRIRWLLWPQIAVAILVTMMAYLNILPIHLLRFPYADKVLHFLLFGAVTFWLQLWWPYRKFDLGKVAIPLSILVPLTIALIEEGFQTLSPIRTGSLLDLGADGAGMLFFYLIAQQLFPQTSTPRRK